MKLKEEVNTLIKKAFANAGIEAEPITVTDATKPEFGDYQFNGAMALAKQLKQNPRQIAQTILDNLETGGILHKAEIAGPGFINLWLNIPVPIWPSRCMWDIYALQSSVIRWQTCWNSSGMK